MEELNLMGSLVGGVLSFVLGGLWYSPLMFGGGWMRGIGKTPEQLGEGANSAVIYGGALLTAVLSALVFSMFLGPEPALGFAVGAGASAGLVWVGGSFGMSYLFERRSLSLWGINAGYHTAQFMIIGAALALI